MLGRKIARHGLAIVATVLLGGLLSATLVRLAPGFDVDEAQLDPHLNCGERSGTAPGAARTAQHLPLLFSFPATCGSWRSGNFAFAGPTGEYAAARARSADAAPGGNRAAAELGRGHGAGTERGVAAGLGV